jgi:pyruvate dehydrogenase E1 component
VLRERLHLEDAVSDEDLADGKEPPYIQLPDSPHRDYLLGRRKALGGPLPSRSEAVRRPLELPAPAVYDEFLAGSKQSVSTTMAFARMFRGLLRDEHFGERVVPIIPDEARTFGMDALFKEFKIYASQGQQYEPVDAKLLLSYTEASDGQLLEEGITEAGAMASFTAAATCYANRGVPMVPFFIFYSMFGFQRVGDLIWAAADARSKGFLLAATAGRTTLTGEGLQHADGHSLLLASSVPSCQAYDAAFAYELAIIVREGLIRMYGPEPESVFYYLTLYNENYPMPALPGDDAEARATVERGIVDGLYRFAPVPDLPAEAPKATVLFSGTAHRAARWARDELAERYGVGIDLWSATSYKRLREEAIEVEEWNRLHPGDTARTPQVTSTLEAAAGPIVAVTDFVRAVPDQVSRWSPKPWVSLGTDGYGRSDTRDALRRFFGTDGEHVVVAVLSQLASAGEIKPEVVADAVGLYGLDAPRHDPTH